MDREAAGDRGSDVADQVDAVHPNRDRSPQQSLGRQGDREVEGVLALAVERQVAQIRDAVYQDVRKAYTNERFEEEAIYLIDFARRRGGIVLSELR